MRRGIACLAASCVALAIALVSVRHLWGPGLDFYSAVWLPGHVMLHGGDPYRLSVMSHADPGASPFPVYGPPHLVVALIVGLLPLHLAAALWGTAGLAVVALLAWIAVRTVSSRDPSDPLLWAAVLTLTAVVILSRPGRDLLDLGQPSLLYLVTTMAAWRYRDRPWIGGLAVAVTLGKPPFAIPLVLLLLAARCRPVLIRGVALGAVISAPILAALAVDEGSFSSVLQAIRQNASFFQQHFPVRGSTRIDAISLVDRIFATQNSVIAIVIGVVVLGAAVAVVDRSHRLGSTDSGPLLAVVALATLIGIVHQDYDLLLLVVPVAMVLKDRRPTLVIAALVPTAVLMLVPARTAARILHTGAGTVLGAMAALLIATFVTLLLTHGEWLRPLAAAPVRARGRELPAGRAVGSGAR